MKGEQSAAASENNGGWHAACETKPFREQYTNTTKIAVHVSTQQACSRDKGTPSPCDTHTHGP